MGNEKSKTSWLGPFSVACVWFSVHVGPGFAGGAQLVQYFAGVGWIGVIIGPVILMLLSIFLVYHLMEFCRTFSVYNYADFYHVAYGKINKIVLLYKDIMQLFTGIVTCALVYATSGSLLNQLWGIPPFVGGIVTLLIVAILVMYGQSIVEKTSTILSVILICMILFIICRTVGASWAPMQEYVGSRVMNTSYPSGIWKIFLYFPLFCSFIDAGMTTAKGNIKSKKDSLFVAIAGSLMVGVCLTFMNIIFAGYMPELANEPLPTLWVLNHVLGEGSIVTYIYVVLSLLALVSTGVAGMYGIVARYELVLGKKWENSTGNSRRLVCMIVFSILAVIFGSVGILSLVNYGYGIMSSGNIFVIYIPFLFLLPYWLHKAAKSKADT